MLCKGGFPSLKKGFPRIGAQKSKPGIPSCAPGGVLENQVEDLASCLMPRKSQGYIEKIDSMKQRGRDLSSGSREASYAHRGREGTEEEGNLYFCQERVGEKNSK